MSHEDIFEESRITLFDDEITGHQDGTAVTFHVLKDGVAFATVETKVKQGRCRVDWKVPKVDDGLDAYELSFQEEIDGRTYKVHKAYKVWPRWVQLEVRRHDHDTPFAYFELTANNAGESSKTLTNAHGKCRVYLSRPAPITFEAVAPGRFILWMKDKGRRRTVKAERKYKAEFVTPVKPSQGDVIRQYVNLPSRHKGTDGHGHQVWVTVGAEGDQKRKLPERHGQPGDVIYLKAVFNRNTQRSTPACTLSRIEELTRVEIDNQHVRTVTAQVRLGPQRTATFLLELGLSGGDTCTLQTGTTEACADAKLEFLNYRRLYYQLTYPNDLPKPSLSDMRLGLADVFVEYQEYESLTYAEGDQPEAPKGSWFDGAMVSDDLPARSVNVGDHNRGFFHRKFRDRYRPRGVHVLVCHTQFDGGKGKSQLCALTSPDIFTTTPKIRFPPDSSWVYGVALDASGIHGHVFERAFQDGGLGWRNARWKSATRSGRIPDDHVHVHWRTRPNIVTVKLPPEAVARLTDGEAIRVSVDVFFVRGPYNGEAHKNRQLIRWRSNSEGGVRGMNGTMLHELGHSMKQTLGNVPPGLSASDHGRKYTGRGHQGSHCAEGVDAGVFNDPSMSLRGRSDCACVMFGEGAPSRPVAFCAKCRPFVCAEDLSDITR